MKKTEDLNKQETISFEQKPKMAICYDFDRTLSPDDMQTFTLIPSFGIDAGEFWHESDELAIESTTPQNPRAAITVPRANSSHSLRGIPFM